MAPKSVTFRRHDHLVSVLFGDLLSHSYNITFSMFLYLVIVVGLIFEYMVGLGGLVGEVRPSQIMFLRQVVNEVGPRW